VDWVTISALATAAGTLVLAIATFASVRSANRAARVAEQSLLVAIRPLLMPTRVDDPVQKVGFADQKWLHVPGGSSVAEVTDEAVYLAIALRNVGTGIAVLHGWYVHPDPQIGVNEHAPLEDFRRLSRDLFVAQGDVGFWQGAFRDPASEEYATARRVVEARTPFAIEILYGDLEGAQRVVTRYGLLPREDGDYYTSPSRHWNIDRPAPR
jgi:hypothetical protein